MRLSSQFLRFYESALARRRQLNCRDMVVLFTIAEEPRTLTVDEIAERCGFVYYMAWNSLKRLAEADLVIDRRLSEIAVELLAAVDRAVLPGASAPETPPPVDADQIF